MVTFDGGRLALLVTSLALLAMAAAASPRESREARPGIVVKHRDVRRDVVRDARRRVVVNGGGERLRRELRRLRLELRDLDLRMDADRIL